MKNFWLVTVPRVVLGLIFLAGAIDGFSFIFTGTHLLHPPTSDRGLQFEAALKATGFFWALMKSRGNHRRKLPAVEPGACLRSGDSFSRHDRRRAVPPVSQSAGHSTRRSGRHLRCALAAGVCSWYATVFGSRDAEPVVAAGAARPAADRSVGRHTITYSYFTQENCEKECTRNPDRSARHPIHPRWINHKQLGHL